MAKRRATKLPKGLAEFEASLHDLRFAPELVRRLADLPKADYAGAIETFDIAMKSVEQAEWAAQCEREHARRKALEIWYNALDSYSVKQLQKTTGYDDE